MSTAVWTGRRERAEGRDNFVSGDTAEGEDSDQGQGSMGEAPNEKDSDLERWQRTSNPPGEPLITGMCLYQLGQFDESRKKKVPPD